MADLIAASIRRVDLAANLEDGLFAVHIIRQEAKLTHILTERILLATRDQIQASRPSASA
ncbi:MAG: hypothetical protein ABFD81_04285 [Syntrophaceae bacterium]